MARFYKTSSAAPTNYIYQLPLDMMANVLQFNEGQIDNIYQTGNLLDTNLAQLPYLTPDEEKAKEIQKGYTSKIEDITKAIAKDPLAWRKYAPNMQTLGKEIQMDVTSGNLAKIQNNYNVFQAWDKNAQDQVGKGKLTADEYNAAKNQIYSSFNGTYDPNTKQFTNVLRPETLMDTMNLTDYLSKRSEGIKPSGFKLTRTSDGSIMYENTTGQKGVSPEKLFNVYLNELASDPQISNYLSQRERYGIMHGNFNENGGLKLYKSLSIDPTTGKLNIDWEDSPISHALQAAIEKNSYMETLNQTSSKGANPYTMANYKFGLEEQGKANDIGRAKEFAGWNADVNTPGTDAWKAAQEQQYKLDLQNQKAQIAAGLSSGNLTPGQAQVAMNEATLKNINMQQRSFDNNPNKLNIAAEARDKTLEGLPTGSNNQTFKFASNTSIDGSSNILKINIDVPNLQRGYLQWLAGRKSNDTLVNEYLRNNVDSNLYNSYRNISNNVKSYLGGNKMIIEHPYNQLFTKLQGLGNKYNDNIESINTSQNNSSSQSLFEPVKDDGTLSSTINNSKDNFVYINEKGEFKPLEDNITKVLGTTGGNANAQSAFLATKSDGTQEVIYSADNPYANYYSKSLGAKYISNKNSVIAKQFNDATFNYLVTEMKQAYTSTDGVKRKPIDLQGKKYIIEENPGGNVNLLNEDGQMMKSFVDLQHLSDYINK